MSKSMSSSNLQMLAFHITTVVKTDANIVIWGM